MAGTATATQDAQGISLRVNGESVSSNAMTLAELVAELGYGDAKIATAYNGEFIAARARATTMLRAGDSIEIVAPREGG
jgi:sulfur carrier protein